jgi:hypothetical protein
LNSVIGLDPAGRLECNEYARSSNNWQKRTYTIGIDKTTVDRNETRTASVLNTWTMMIDWIRNKLWRKDCSEIENDQRVERDAEKRRGERS